MGFSSLFLSEILKQTFQRLPSIRLLTVFKISIVEKDLVGIFFTFF